MKPSSIVRLTIGLTLLAAAAILLAKNHRAGFSGVPNEPTSVKAVDTTGADGPGQIVEIMAKGGYNPALAHARAGVPLVLKIKTDGTFDCSAELRIPSIGWSQNLSATGEVAIKIPAQKSGTEIMGVCSMGMYHFKIDFK